MQKDVEVMQMKKAIKMIKINEKTEIPKNKITKIFKQHGDVFVKTADKTYKSTATIIELSKEMI